MAYILYTTTRAPGMDDTQSYIIGAEVHRTMKTVRETLADRQGDMPKGYELVWRVLDCSVNGGWCDESSMAWKIIKGESANFFTGLVRF